MSPVDRRRFTRMPVSLVTRLDLNGTDLRATAVNISREGAFIVCADPLPVGENDPILVEVVTDAAVFEIPSILLGPRELLPTIQSRRGTPRFGFGIRFNALDSVLAPIFESILDGLSREALTISLRLRGFSRQGRHLAAVGSSPGDRRDMPRMNILLPVAVGMHSQSLKAAQCSLVNLSATGACLEITADRAALVDFLTLKISLPPLLQQEMSTLKADLALLTAEVMWIKPVTTIGAGPTDATARFLVGVRFLYHYAEGQKPIVELVGQLLIASDRFDQLQVGGVIATEGVEFQNELGQRIAGYVDRPKRVLPGSPIAIISPGYGESKQAYVTLGYYLADNGFHVLRYDHCNHVGESDGDSTKTTLTGFRRDLEAAVTFAKEIMPRSAIAVIASGLAGRVALKTAAADRRIDLLLILTGILDLQLACLTIHQEDLIVTYLRGTRRGVSNLMGLEIDTDRFLQDAIKAGYADLRTSLRDARQVQVPVIFFATQEEAAGPLSAVNEVRAAIGQEELSQVLPIPQALSQLHESPRKEWAMFRQLVSCCMAHLSPEVPEWPLVEPAQVEIGRQNRLERQRAKMHRATGTSTAKEFWQAYLDHFHCLANIPEYWHLIDDISRLLEPMEKGMAVLDAGCGPGNLGICMLINELYRRRTASGLTSEGLRYVGMEVAQSALIRARMKFSDFQKDSMFPGSNFEAPCQIQTSLTCADLNHPLPFRDHQFDRVICNLVLGYLEDPMASLRELVRVLAPGGRIIVTSLKPYADLIEIYRAFMLRTDLPEEVDEAEHLLNTACKIKQAESDGVFRSFQPDELAMLLVMSGATEPRISSALADQAYIVVADKLSRDFHQKGIPGHLPREASVEPAIAVAAKS